MQDMGAAGIICSNSEMSAKGEHGMEIHLDRVPMRQENMLPWEILLSESQERMLIVVEKGKEAIVEQIFDKWDLNRSEEHTSELQSLMRISYAVLCLKKKIQRITK